MRIIAKIRRKFRHIGIKCIDRYRSKYFAGDNVLQSLPVEASYLSISNYTDEVCDFYLQHRFDLLGSGW